MRAESWLLTCLSLAWLVFVAAMLTLGCARLPDLLANAELSDASERVPRGVSIATSTAFAPVRSPTIEAAGQSTAVASSPFAPPAQHVQPTCTTSGAMLALPSLVPIPRASEEWQLVFSDEFDGPALDSSKWTPEFWWGATHGHAELQYYTAENLEFSNGLLRLKAIRQDVNGYHFTSGMISSHGKFNQQYGYFETRARVPKGKGLWPAIWLLPDLRRGVTWPPEIDVMEILGYETNVVHLTYHYLNSSGKHQQDSARCTAADFSQGFHKYAVEWTPTAIVWFVDDIAYARTQTTPPAVPMYLIINLAVGDWAGTPENDTPFPSYFDIDYVHVFNRVAGE